MGLSISVTGYTSPESETYQKHKKVVEVCVEAGLSELPRETAEYFDSIYPSLDLLDEKLETDIIHHEFQTEYQSGYEVLMSEIPKDIYKIRFSLSH